MKNRFFCSYAILVYSLSPDDDLVFYSFSFIAIFIIIIRINLELMIYFIKVEIIKQIYIRRDIELVLKDIIK